MMETFLLSQTAMMKIKNETKINHYIKPMHTLLLSESQYKFIVENVYLMLFCNVTESIVQQVDVGLKSKLKK